MFSASQTAQLESANLLQTAELFGFIVELLSEVDKAKSDDGKISYVEGGLMTFNLTPELLDAIRGSTHILNELSARELTPGDIELLGDVLAPWFTNTNTSTRDRVSALIGVVRECVNLWNVFYAPKAHPVE